MRVEKGRRAAKAVFVIGLVTLLLGACAYGTPHGLLWEAFKSGAIMPIGERQLRNIFAG